MGKSTKHKDEFLVELGKRVREQRNLSGYTQEKLAEKADLSAQMISTTERATKEIKIENLYKLSPCTSYQYGLSRVRTRPRKGLFGAGLFSGRAVRRRQKRLEHNH